MLRKVPILLAHTPIKEGKVMTHEEISKLLKQESYRVWDTNKVIKNHDYHDGLVKGLELAAKFVAKL